MLCLFLFLILCINGSFLPPFTPFNVNASTRGYSINGSFCYSFADSKVCQPIVSVFDPPNNRLAFFYGTTGTTIITSDSAYVWGQVLFPQCLRVNGFNYSQEVDVLSKATSIYLSNEDGLQIYTGLVKESATCNHDLSIMVQQWKKVIIQINYSQKVPIPIGPGESICYLSNSYVIHERSTLRYATNLDSYFVLRDDCSDPGDYCSLVYPVDNPCVIDQ